MTEQDQPASLTAGLVDLIGGKPISAADLDVAAHLVLDAIANMIAGKNSAAGHMLLKFAAGRQGDPGRQALLYGGLTHIHEVDDLHKASVVHPGCVTVPAALALSRAGETDGPKFLTSVIHGFEACTRVGMAVGPAHYKIWHNTATCGVYGSAMAAGKLLGLNKGQLIDALGNAGTQSAGLWQFLASGAMSKHLHAGRAAEAGVVAAELAALGFTGPPAILEGPQGFFAGACPDADPSAVLRAPDAPWQIHATSIKPWPCCRHTHPTIDAAVELAGQVRAEDITAIRLQVYQAAADVCDRADVQDSYQAKFSLQHCVAHSLMTGRCGFDSFDASARRKAAEMAAKVHVMVQPRLTEIYPDHWGCEVVVELTSGARLTATRDACRGDPELPVTPDELRNKARDLMIHGGVESPDPLIAAILSMSGGGLLPTLPF